MLPAQGCREWGFWSVRMGEGSIWLRCIRTPSCLRPARGGAGRPGDSKGLKSRCTWGRARLMLVSPVSQEIEADRGKAEGFRAERGPVSSTAWWGSRPRQWVGDSYVSWSVTPEDGFSDAWKCPPLEPSFQPYPLNLPHLAWSCKAVGGL